jgi:hypothetical protein
MPKREQKDILFAHAYPTEWEQIILIRDLFY